MRLIHPDLVPLLRRADSQARDFLEALVTGRNTNGTQRAHIRDTKSEWAEADGGAGAVDASFTRFDNGDLRLKDTTNTLFTRTSHPNNFTDLNREAPFDAAVIDWGGALASAAEILRVKFWLNPRVSGSQRREVVKWRLELYALESYDYTEVVSFDGVYVPLAEPVDVAVTTDSAGEITFDFSGQVPRPQPKTILPQSRKGGSTNRPPPRTLFVVYALNADGDSAANVAMGVNDAESSFTDGGGQTLRRVRFGRDPELGFVELSPSNLGVPHLVIENGTYTAATITFSSGNLFDLGGSPTQDVELVGQVQLPPGTAVTLEVRNDADSGWVAFTNGQFEEANLGLTSGQSRKLRATLTPNGAGTLTPALRRLGRREVVRVDLSRVASIKGYEQAFDPLTHQVEIPRPTLAAVKDGIADFRSKIEKLLAENFVSDILIRWFVGAPTLSRDKWTHMDDFLVLDARPRRPVIELQLVGLCALLKSLAPPFSPGTNYAPDGDVSVGNWTTDVGGSSNLFQRVDEATPDETDYVQSALSPTDPGAQVTFTLPTPTGLAGRRLFVDCQYAKDASGGETIQLKIQVYRSTALVVELVKADIGPDRIASTLELTESQIADLSTDLPNARLAFTAHVTGGAGARRARVFWAQLRSGGKREVVNYSGQTLKAVYDDLMVNRLAMPANLIGPGVENATTTVTKQITGLRSRQPSSKDVVGKTEVEAIAFLADRAIGSSEGRIKAFDLSPAQPIKAVFRSRRIQLGEVSLGLQRRIPEFFVPYRWDPEKEEFKDELRAFHTQSILHLGTVGLGPPKWLDEEIAKWIDTDALAETMGRRVVDRLGTGEMLWAFTSVDRYPELEMGDVVAVETDLFVARDPNLDIEIKGRRWAVGPLQRVGQGRYFTVHPRGYADILSSAEPGTRVLTVSLLSVVLTWEDDHLFVHWTGDPQVRSVKIATSTSAFPAAGTGTTAEGNSGIHDAGAFTYGQPLYVTATPYPGTGALGTQGLPSFAKSRIPWAPGQWDPATGKRRRSAQFDDGKFALKASDTVGKETDDDLFVSSSKTVKVGTVASPATITKTVRLNASGFVPQANGITWTHTGLYVRPGTVNVSAFFFGAVYIPKGVTITNVEARLYRQTSSDVGIIAINRHSSDTTSILATLTASSTGWHNETSGVSQLVGAEHYSCSLELKGVSATLDARLQWVEITYTMPSYDKGI